MGWGIGRKGGVAGRGGGEDASHRRKHIIFNRSASFSKQSHANTKFGDSLLTSLPALPGANGNWQWVLLTFLEFVLIPGMILPCRLNFPSL